MADSRSSTHELESMSDKLEDYLLDEELYKTITVHAPEGEHLIKMTIGGMLERLEELRAHDASNPVIVLAEGALERAQTVMPDRYFAKLAREAKSYTDSWNWFLQNCWEGDGRCRSDYAQEVPLRLRVARLLDSAGERPELADTRARVRSLDHQLEEIWEESDEPVLAGATAERYPVDRYWWLYGRPAPRTRS